MTKPPIFIVGVPRSGTTLLAAQLAAHSQMSCGPETHFFRWLAQAELSELCQYETWPDRAMTFLSSISAATYSPEGRIRLIDRYDVSEAEVASFLRQRQPSIANMLASITSPYMARMGKQRWVEKTPDHLEYVNLIRQHFPDSPIIRIVRDPRDVALSLRNVPWGAKTLPEALLFWKRLDENSAAFFASDGLGYTLRFEDLLSSPRETLKRLCEFIGEQFEEKMLDTSRSGRAVNSRRAAWKEKASQPIDRSRIAIWRGALSAEENGLAEALAGDCLERYRYPRLVQFDQLGELYPAPLPADKYATELAEIAGRGIRFWRKHPAEKPAARIYLGSPGEYSWLGERRSERVLRTAALTRVILRARLSRSEMFWIPNNQTRPQSPSQGIANSGYCAYLLQKLLGPYRVSQQA
jgi:hypothetical protein